jgi:FdhD protein
VLTVYDIGEHCGAPYIVTECLEGEPLRARLNAGTLPVDTALDIALQFCSEARTGFQQVLDLSPGIHYGFRPATARLSCWRMLELEEMADDPSDLALQLPPYRFPQVFNLLRQVSEVQALVRAIAHCSTKRLGLLFRPSEEVVVERFQIRHDYLTMASAALQRKRLKPIIPLMQEFTVRPQPEDPRLTRSVTGIDHEGRAIETAVVMERPLTLFLNGREIVTMMTIGDHPDYLAVGYLLNKNMLRSEDRIIGIDYDDELETVVVRTDRETDFEDKLKKKTLTSGCAQGTVFGDLMEKFEEVRLDPEAVLRTSWLYALTRKINTAPSLYLAAGAIHGCVLCEEDRPLLYMEDVGRHNAIDKIAGYMHLNHISPAGKIFYTTGRLTSEMVIKTVQMGIPILISRSGFTAWGVDLARQAGLTLIGRAKGKRFVALAGCERIVFDGDVGAVADEHPRWLRKASRAEEDAA